MALIAAYALNDGTGTTAAEINGGTSLTGISGWDATGGPTGGPVMRLNLQVGPTIPAFPVDTDFGIMFDVEIVGTGNNSLNMLLDGVAGQIGTLQQGSGNNAEWYPWLGPGSGAIPYTTYTNVAVVASGTYRRILINGVQTANVANTELSGTNTYVLGGRASYEANARFANLRIFDHGPSDAEVLALAGTPVAAPGPAQGSATGLLTFTGSAAGATVRRGTGGGTLAFTGAAVGKRSPKGSGNGTLAFVGNATGKRAPKATGSGTLTFTGSAVGNAPTPGVSEGSASGSLTFAGTAVGKRQPKGSAVGTLTLAGSAVGARQPVATAAGTLTWVGTAVGQATPAIPSGRILSAPLAIPTATAGLSIPTASASLALPIAEGALA